MNYGLIKITNIIALPFGALRALRLLALVLLILSGLIAFVSISKGAPIQNPVAAFSGLDKITGRLTEFDVYMNETVQFGALQITPRVCYTRPSSEIQRVSVFVEVDEISLQGAIKRIFSGWMFAESPALNAVDHPVYDIWLVSCKQSSEVPTPDSR